MSARLAEDLVASDAEKLCLAKLRELAGSTGGPIERHSLRVYLIARELARTQGGDVDQELLLCAALLHDAGLYPGAATSQAYVSDGRVLAHRLLRELDWTAERLTLCGDAVERHHELTPQFSRGVEVELIRRADLVEVSQTLVRFGLARDWLQRLRTDIPVQGFLPEVLRQLAVAARQRPRSLPRIFRPGEPPAS